MVIERFVLYLGEISSCIRVKRDNTVFDADK